MAETLENQVLHTLGQVLDDHREQNIVSLGMVKDITVEECLVSCILEFRDNDHKKNSKIFEDSKKAIEEIPGVTKVNIITTYHQEHSKIEDDERFEATMKIAKDQPWRVWAFVIGLNVIGFFSVNI